MRHLKYIFRFFLKHHLLYSAMIMALATLLAAFFFHYDHSSSANIALIYILALLLIARRTGGYLYGLAATIFAVACINFLFTYPFLELNFRLSGYPITFVAMTIISMLATTSVIHLRRQNVRLEEQERQLLEAEREKTRANLLRAVSHDLRTPLTGIIGSSSAYLNNADFYSEESRRELVKNINDDAHWLLEMVENLLSITKIQNENHSLKTSPEVVDEVVSEVMTKLKKRHPDAEVSVITPNEFLMIPMDAMLIEQVLLNLLENALTHSQSQEPLLFAVESGETDVTFRVIDYGIGIPEDRLATIFDGTNENLPTVDGHKGMGIGLSICKTIITAHKGLIAARNHDSGAEFYFTLPKEELHEPQI